MARASQCNPCASWPLSYRTGGEFANGLWNSRLRILNLYASPASTTSAEGANRPTYSLQQVCFLVFKTNTHHSVVTFLSFSVHEFLQTALAELVGRLWVTMGTSRRLLLMHPPLFFSTSKKHRYLWLVKLLSCLLRDGDVLIPIGRNGIASGTPHPAGDTVIPSQSVYFT